MTDADALLRRHQPRLYYDSQEAFFADSAATWTDNPGNVLRRGPTADSELLAAAGGTPPLSLGFLSGTTYPGGERVDDDDTIGDPSRNYRQQAAALHTQPQYRNHIYGHAVAGSDGRTWLQYWFFSFYNDYAVAGFGLHEGDWEMIQLRLDAHDVPDLAVYAQHKTAERRPWAKVERAADDHDAPVVYVARGSHASYFTTGPHWTGVWFDRTNGRRRAKDPATLEIVGDASPGWIAWPGVWGDTRAAFAGDPLDQPSPRGPVAHAQWSDPVALIEEAARAEAAPVPARPVEPPLPATLTVRRVAGRLEVDYRFGTVGPAHAPPAKLVVTVNSKDDALPPASETFEVAASGAGTVRPTREVQADQRYDVNVSAVSAEGVATTAVEVLIAAGEPSAAWPPGPARS